MNKIYIAAPWTHRDQLPGIAEVVTRIGYTITHDWWNRDIPSEDHVRLQVCAQNDKDAVAAADVFLLLNFEKSEGKSVETGMAIILGKRLIGVGPRYSNIFQNLPGWEWFETIDEAYKHLQLIDRLKLGHVTW